MKRLIDVVGSCFGLFLLSPVLLAVSVVVGLTSPGPILFRQTRVGKKGSLFEMYKFRTMHTDAPPDAPTHLLDEARSYLTPVGAFLRKTSLDELPQMLNILKGEMSIVGPRPALWNQYDLIAERERLGVDEVRPGLTGWAQINGRDELPVDQKAALDGYYVENMSLVFDLSIIFRTVFAAFRGDGVVEGTSNPAGLPRQPRSAK